MRVRAVRFFRSSKAVHKAGILACLAVAVFAMALTTSAPATAKVSVAEACERRANDNVSAGNLAYWREALAICEQAFKADPTSVEIRYLYYKSLFDTLQFPAALKGFQELADKEGHAGSLAWLGYARLEGYGVPRDHSLALKDFRRALEAGSPRAADLIGYMYLNGWGVEQDFVMARSYFELADRLGDTLAGLDLGYLYRNGVGVPVDNAAALKWFRKSAAAGRQSAVLWVGGFYEKGIGVQVDRARAERIYRSAMDRGYSDAMVALADLYIDSTDKNKTAQGLALLRKAIDLGETSALTDLGERHLYGSGLPRNPARARELFQQAIDLGDKWGNHWMGN